MARDVAIGIDIGGTNTVFGFVDREGHCLAEGSVPTQSQLPAAALVERLTAAVTDLHAPLAETTIVGIGIGAPNANYHRGTIEHPPNLGWKGTTPIVDLFTARFNRPVAVTNDANAAALGEVLFGAARGMRDVIVITLGTGLGSGIVANGDLVYGADGFAGEIGHVTVDPNGRWCGCGKRGCLETYASATGICRTVFEQLCLRRNDSRLRAVSFNDLTAKMVADAAHDGDVIAQIAFEETGRILGMKLADSVAHTSPEAIILFGGLAHAGGLLFIPTKRSLDANLMSAFQGHVKLLPSGLPEGNSAVLGAAALIWKELDKRGS